MKHFRHEYRVFEVSQTSGVQFEVILISNPDRNDDHRRPDRVTTGTHIGKLRLLVDLAHMDAFAVGKKFSVVLEAKDEVPA